MHWIHSFIPPSNPASKVPWIRLTAEVLQLVLNHLIVSNWVLFMKCFSLQNNSSESDLFGPIQNLHPRPFKDSYQRWMTHGSKPKKINFQSWFRPAACLLKPKVFLYFSQWTHGSQTDPPSHQQSRASNFGNAFGSLSRSMISLNPMDKNQIIKSLWRKTIRLVECTVLSWRSFFQILTSAKHKSTARDPGIISEMAETPDSIWRKKRMPQKMFILYKCPLLISYVYHGIHLHVYIYIWGLS